MKTIPFITAALLAGSLSLHAQSGDWEKNLDLGATVTRGNSETLLATLAFAATKDTGDNAYAFDVSYTYGETDNNEGTETTADEWLAGFSWNHLVSERTYVGLLLDFRSDSLADIDYRISTIAKIGYYLIKSEKTSLDVEAGVGYTYEKIGGLDDDYATVYVGEHFKHQFNDHVSVFQTFEAFAPLDNTDRYRIIATAGVESKLSDSLSLKVFVENKYEAEPAAGSDNNDLKVVTGISYSF